MHNELNRNVAAHAWDDRAFKAQLGDLSCETRCFLFRRNAVEVAVAEVLIEGSVS